MQTAKTNVPKKMGSCPMDINSLLISKKSYRVIADEFHFFHSHDLNVLLHLITTSLGLWGTLQTLLLYAGDQGLIWIAVYGALVFLTVPLSTGLLHSVVLAALTFATPGADTNQYLTVGAIVAGYVLQDVAHWLCVEPTYLGSYITTNPTALVLHSFWLLPLVLDSVLMRSCFLPHLVPRNSVVLVKQIQCVSEVLSLREWVTKNVAAITETTHLWPHKQGESMSKWASAIEMDPAIFKGFRQVFDEVHYDILPVVPMNEIYVTAVGDRNVINSDKVFYTPHTDGPFWFTPGASLYRVLVGLTPNTLVRTRFNNQYGPAVDHVLDMKEALGFDYNKELHWIDHTDEPNQERRSLLKLHYVVYPKGWHTYGRLVAKWNTQYNTWARGNFLETLRPDSFKQKILAWWIWLTTWSNALFVLHIGWWNLVYILGSLVLGTLNNKFHFTALPIGTLLLSYRHYLLYMTTFAYREPKVAFGNLMRDAKLFKTLALVQLAYRILPVIELDTIKSNFLINDATCTLVSVLGFSITLLATARLGFVRTYFGSELGYVKPEWISGFPYGTIPHPMIVGQLVAFGTLVAWFGGFVTGTDNRLGEEAMYLIFGHMGFYTLHMVQEMLTSSY